MRKLEYQKLNNFYNMEAVYSTDSSDEKDKKRILEEQKFAKEEKSDSVEFSDISFTTEEEIKEEVEVVKTDEKKGKKDKKDKKKKKKVKKVEEKKGKKRGKKQKKNFVALNLNRRYKEQYRGAVRFLRKHKKGNRRSRYAELKEKYKKLKNPDA